MATANGAPAEVTGTEMRSSSKRKQQDSQLFPLSLRQRSRRLHHRPVASEPHRIGIAHAHPAERGNTTVDPASEIGRTVRTIVIPRHVEHEPPRTINATANRNDPAIMIAVKIHHPTNDPEHHLRCTPRHDVPELRNVPIPPEQDSSAVKRPNHPIITKSHGNMTNPDQTPNSDRHHQMILRPSHQQIRIRLLPQAKLLLPNNKDQNLSNRSSATRRSQTTSRNPFSTTRTLITQHSKTS